MKVLSQNGYREAGTRSFEIVEEKYLFLTDHEYFRVLNNNNEVQIGNNCVHLLKIEYNQTYVITYLKRIREDLFRCPYFIRKSSNVNSFEISVLDWQSDCIHVYNFDHSNETVSDCVETKKFLFEDDNNNNCLYSYVFLCHEDLIYLTRLLPKPGFRDHKHYNGHDKIYIFQKQKD